MAENPRKTAADLIRLVLDGHSYEEWEAFGKAAENPVDVMLVLSSFAATLVARISGDELGAAGPKTVLEFFEKMLDHGGV